MLTACVFPWSKIKQNACKVVSTLRLNKIYVWLFLYTPWIFGTKRLARDYLTNKAYMNLYNKQINVRALIDQSATVYCASKLMEISCVF